MASATTSAFNENGDQQEQQLSILLIENDPAAAVLTREVFKEVGLHNGVTAVRDGDEALAYLRCEENYTEPDVIFLDLHLPKKSGLEVLSEIKNNPIWAAMPIVVVSGSADPVEIRRAYELHASCYIRKPADLDQFLRFMRTCYEFWGSVVTLPSRLNK
ncbi:MAG: response regulator [Acidobacteriota bacterium]|nr:response regulator [Acidobacteriota bacterium]